MDSAHYYSYHSHHSHHPHHHPTPPYHSSTYASHAVPFVSSSNKHSAYPRHIFDQDYLQLQQQQMPLAIDTKFEHTNNSVSAPPSACTSNNSSTNSKEQQQTTIQLADFAAHMVCYLLFGHKDSSAARNNGLSTSRTRTSTCCASNPASPSSTLPHHISGHSTHNRDHNHHHSSSPYCLCKICNPLSDSSSGHRRHTTAVGSPISSSPSSPSYPTRHYIHEQHSRQHHRRILSESDIVQPRPLFRKFCLDVLSATLLSPSVILLSLKYIQQLMINLKENNKTPSTSEGSEFRLFTGALILANKFLDDNTFTNKTWANITGISVKEVNYIELQFLQGIGFRLFTRSCDYTEWLASLTHFTGKYMPSQYLVAFQQQTVAALSPISPVDPTTGTPETPLPTPETVAGNLILSTPPPLMHQDRGSGWGSSFGNYSRSTQDQNSYRTEASASLSTGAGAGYSVASTAGPVGAATGSILPHQYTSSVKPAQHRSSFGHRSQRGIPPPTLTTNFLAATTLEKTTPSYHFATSTHPTMNEPREQQPFSYGSYQGSSAPVSAAWTSPSGSSTPHVHARHHYRQQQSRYVDSSLSATRKRSATIAFDEIMDRSPSYEWIGSAANGSAVPSSNSSSLNFSNQSSTSRISHKRVSSSSSMVHMMKELSAGAPTMFQAGYSPVIQSRVNSSHRQHLNRLTATTVPSQRVSTGTMPAPYRGHHHRSASGSHCIGVSEYSAFVHEPSHMATVPSSPQYYVPSQRQFSIKHDGYYTDSVAPALSTKTPPYSSPLSSRKSYNRSNDHYHDLSPSSLMDYRGPEARGMATTENCTEASPYRYEIDPRLWGPLDNLSLYAMTTQAAKRVFAQSKVLAASTSDLSTYYPTTPA